MFVTGEDNIPGSLSNLEPLGPHIFLARPSNNETQTIFTGGNGGNGGNEPEKCI
jgi:hypothetical protein